MEQIQPIQSQENPEELWRLIQGSPMARKRLGRASLRCFCPLFFPTYIFHPMAELQKEMLAIAEDDATRFAVICAFRGSGKSTLISQLFPVWAVLGRLESKFILIASQTQNQSRTHLSNIRKELERNEILRKHFPIRIEESNEWSLGSLVIPGYNARITAVSVDQSIRGLRHLERRPDIIICDDVEDSGSVKTIEGRDKTYHWLTREMLPAGDINTKVIIVGNLLHEDSLIMRLKQDIEEGKRSGIFRRYPFEDDEGQLAWPGKFSSPAIIDEAKRQIGHPFAWEREYMLRIVPERGTVIPKEWIHYYDTLPDEHDEEKLLCIATGIDLAISEKQTADYTAMVSARVYRKGKELIIYILPNPVNERMDFPTAIDRAKLLAKTLGNGRPTLIFVEDVAYQRSFPQQLRREGYPAKGVALDGQDKLARLTLTSPRVQYGSVRFAAKGNEELVNQITNYGVEKRDDLVDAFTILVLHLIEKYSTTFAFFREDGTGFRVSQPDAASNKPKTREELEREADLGRMLEDEYERDLFRRSSDGWL